MARTLVSRFALRTLSTPIVRTLAFATLAMAALPLRAAGQSTTLADASTRRFRFDAVALRPGQFAYQMSLERDAGATMIGTRTISASLSTYAGSPAWLLLETRTADSTGAIAFADSLFTDPLLRPLHWSATLGNSRLGAEFRADTVYGATSAPSGRRSMVGVVPIGALVSSAMLESVLRVLPLRSAWEDSASIVSVTPATNAVVPARLAVIAEDRVNVPAGTFDCWVVSVRADVGRSLYWVTKQDPMVVRSAMDVPTMGGAQLVYALTRIGP
jgi:hypothetical protein